MSDLTVEKLRACAKELLDYDPVAREKAQNAYIEFCTRSLEDNLKIVREIEHIESAQNRINQTFRIKQ